MLSSYVYGPRVLRGYGSRDLRDRVQYDLRGCDRCDHLLRGYGQSDFRGYGPCDRLLRDGDRRRVRDHDGCDRRFHGDSERSNTVVP